MEPKLAGTHLVASCSQCGQKHRIAAEFYSPERPVQCPHCGRPSEVSTERLFGDILSLQSPDTLVPKRFSLLAFRAGGKLAVKRIWGLPGEEVAICDGELFLDGELLQKSLSELRQIAVPIVTEWQDAGQTSGEFGREYILKPQYPNPKYMLDSQALSPMTPSWVVDDYSCNQGLSYQTQRVFDFALELSTERGVGNWSLQINAYDLAVDVKVVLPRETESKLGWDGSSICVPATESLTLAVCDERILVSDNRDRTFECIVEVESIKNVVPRWTVEHGLARIRGVTGKPTTERVWRDLYLRSNSRTGDGRLLVETKTGFFVLGDNQPSSIDSRNGLGRILVKDIVGVTVRAE